MKENVRDQFYAPSAVEELRSSVSRRSNCVIIRTLGSLKATDAV